MERYRSRVYFTDRVILAAYSLYLRTLAKFRQQTSRNARPLLIAFVENPLRISLIFSKRLQFPLFLRDSFASVFCTPALIKQLDWIELNTEAANKYRNYSCLYMSLVAVASPWSTLSLVELSIRDITEVRSEPSSQLKVVYSWVSSAH